MRNREIDRIADRYLKIVEWSDEDKCFVGRCPGLFFGGCHGADEVAVYHELREIVREHVGYMLERKKQLPPATAGRSYSGKFVVRMNPELHKKISMQAESRGESLNQFVNEVLAGV
jgi:predicted HicB family RNase H-like nuclease